MTLDKNSPLPWAIKMHDNNVWIKSIISSAGHTVADMRFKNGVEDAKFIALACNSHYDLVAALKFAQGIIGHPDDAMMSIVTDALKKAGA